MKILHINVADTVATYQRRDGSIVCGNKEKYKVKFNFDSEWDAYWTKTARFIYGGTCIDVIFTGDTCDVPPLRDVELLAVGVFADDLITTTPALIPCLKSIRCEEGAPADPTPEVYDQIIELLNSGDFEGRPGKEGHTPVRGIDYWTEDDQEEIKADNVEFISKELAKRGQLAPEFANDTDECTDTSKLYVLPDGYIYGYVRRVDQEEIPMETVGLVEGSTSKTWHTVNTATNGLRSDYVPIVAGYKYIKAYVKANQYMFAIIFFDSSKNAIYDPSVVGDLRTEPYIAEIPTNAAYVMVSQWHSGNPPAPTAYFYNEGYAYKWASTGHAFVPADYENRIVALEEADQDHEQRLSAIEESGISAEAIYNGLEFSLFRQWGVVGDSLSVGHTSTSGGTASSPNIYYSWGQYLARRIGNTCLNFGSSGLSTKTWMTSGQGYNKLIADGNLCQCYIIALGANLTGLSIGSISDVDFSNMNNNADTEYGWYAKVINAVRTTAPTAPIFLFTLPYPRNTDTNIQAMNNMIRTLAANENFSKVYLVDLDADYNEYFKSGKLGNCIGNTGWHLTALGYLYASKVNEVALSKVISENYADFQDVFTIPYDEQVEG